MTWLTLSRGDLVDLVSGAHPGSICGVEEADEMFGQMNFYDASGYGFESDALPDKGSADETQSSVPFDVSMGPHTPHSPVGGITRLGQVTGKATRTFAVVLGRHLLVQALVRALSIVVGHPTSDAGLLPTRRPRRRVESLGLENPMHLFVPPVVFGMSTANDVHADHSRQTKAAKQPRHISPHGAVALVGQQADAQHHTAAQIAHRQRFAARPVAGAKPAF